MKSCHNPWNTSREFLTRMADLSLAHVDGSWRRTNRYGELCWRQLIAQWPLAIAPTADNAAYLHEISRDAQDELLEDSCNLLQIAFMIESELMYWGDCLTHAWWRSGERYRETSH